MNTQHLQYIIEIERTRSISQAAENLFLGQPNLSRILHDMEANLGFRIFERTSRGVRPTERGASFLQHARNVMREVDYIDALGPRHAVPYRLRVSIPRSARLLSMTAGYLASFQSQGGLDAQIRECHARQTLQRLGSGETDVGIIRFRSEYAEYFEEQAEEHDLNFHILNKFKYQLLFPADHPLAPKTSITMADLEGYTEIAHGDNLRLRSKQEEARLRKIHALDRQAQLMLLQTIWGAYLWNEQQPSHVLSHWKLVQKPCVDNPVTYHDALLYNPQYVTTDIQAGFVRFILSQSQI